MAVNIVQAVRSLADILRRMEAHQSKKRSLLRPLNLALALAGATFVVGLLRGQPAIDMFMASLALLVGAIPEGV